jgi:hypothetical protein
VLGAPASATSTITGYGSGDGTTAALAERAAVMDLHGSFGHCGPYSLDYDTEYAPGLWTAEVSAGCTSYN